MPLTPHRHPRVLETDRPLRLPAPSARRSIQVEASRQLRASLWLLAIMGVALAATLASRPHASQTTTILDRPAPAPIVASTETRRAVALR